MPVRKIPKNYLVVTGGFSSKKNGVMTPFESLLEKDELLQLDFDKSVVSFEVQPVRVPVDGVPRGYVPDILVKYEADSTGLVPKPKLIEVKHSDHLARNALHYAPKFEAAHQYSEVRGWEFATKDQTEIRSVRLANLKFLREYRNVTPSNEDMQVVAGAMVALGQEATSESLLSTLAPVDEDRLHWLPVIWSMVVTGHLQANLNEPFLGEIPLWLGEAS